MLFNMCRNVERLSEDSGTRWLEDGEGEEEHKESKEEKSKVMATSVLSPAASCLSSCPLFECHRAMTKAERSSFGGTRTHTLAVNHL